MRVEHNHAHAYNRYSLLNLTDYLLLIRSAYEAKTHHYLSLTIHLPFEIQHPEKFNLKKAKTFIKFGETLKRLLNLKLYWENAPWLNYGKWDLKYTNTDWRYIPKNIDLCLDTGHLMLGAGSKKQFLTELKVLLRSRGRQIKHLHLHENDFKTDQHRPVPGKVIDGKTFIRLTQNRSYIVEKGE